MTDARHILFSKLTFEEAPAAPDSTTSMFVEGEDVLVDRNHTGQYFMGTIVQIDRPTEKCYLRFLDNKECWAHLSELQRVKDDPEEILCVVCKKIEQNVVRCPKCGRGYHRACLEPSVPEGIPASKWHCIRCGTKTLKKKRARLSLNARQSNSESTSLSSKKISVKSPSTVESELKRVSNALLPFPSTSNDVSIPPVKKTRIRSFPYAIQSLAWDEAHKVNHPGLYCYCGKPGNWYMQMLQCAHCRQWFHQDCLSCLHFPLYCGDQLYLFLCSVCNDDEFLRRFDFGWVDIVHLAIFNLILFKKKKYFDLDTEIIPYVKRNSFYLQISAQLVKCSDAELRRIILKMLEDNSTKSCRFKLGREIHTKKRIWGLRIRVPPKRIPFSLPPVRPLTDDAVRTWWKKCHITFHPPLDSKYLMSGDTVLQPEGTMAPFDYSVMYGDAPCPGKVVSRNVSELAIGVHLLDSSILNVKLPLPPNGAEEARPTSENFVGYAKKSSAFSACNRLMLQESLRRNHKALQNRVSARGRAQSKKNIGSELSDDVLENSSQDGYESLDSQTSYSQDDHYVSSNGGVSPDEESLDENDLSQDGYDSSEEESDGCGSSFAPDDCHSVDSPDEDTASKDVIQSSSEQAMSENVQDSSQSKASDEKHAPESVEQVPVEQCADYISPADTPSLSGTIDTPQVSSPATESVIPSVSSTPADTDAEEELGSALESQTSSLPTIADLIGSPIVTQKPPTVPLIPSLPQLTPVIKEPPQARAVKRKLSEKDIKIVNGQVKQKRRLRRCQSNQIFGQRTKTVHLDSGEKIEKRIVGGKLLRSPLKPSVPETTPDLSLSQVETASSSSTPRPEEITVDDLKRDIKSIFSASNRIAAGEKFLIKGRRVTANGVEYLIQWDYSL